MNAETVTYVILVASGGAVLAAYCFLILVPAWSAYGRVWEKLAATMLTVFVVAAFVGVGIAAGLLIVYFWDDIIGVFSAMASPAVPLLTIS